LAWVEKSFVKIVHLFLVFAWISILLGVFCIWLLYRPRVSQEIIIPPTTSSLPADDAPWRAPDVSTIPKGEEGALIHYGKQLIEHTASFLGPSGSVATISNGMNCQNCHLKAGTLPFGNNYSAVASTYPKFRERSGSIESIEKRVNDCLERSLNGQSLDSTSREMRAVVAYINWLGKEVPKNVKPKGAGLAELKCLDRAADPMKGKMVFEQHCVRCHGANGEGLREEKNSVEWKYPPLWGDGSYNYGAGLFRLSRFAGYVKMNMPNDLANYQKPVLTDEEAWDVAAFVNSMPRPSKDISMDWPVISSKPFDHPFGPYADSFTETQHKLGPFNPIIEAKKKIK
jgi:thiosulfate dehydrogenase